MSAKNEIAPTEIEDIDVTIKLAKRDVEVLCGKIKYPIDFLVLGSPQDDFCPITFGRPFLNTINATIHCHKQTASVSFGDESHEFIFLSLVGSIIRNNFLVRMK